MTGPHGENGRGPLGMLTHSDWRPFGHNDDRYDDGINLVAVCPNGLIWDVDGPAVRDGEVTHHAWTRSGDPRQPSTLTVAPRSKMWAYACETATLPANNWIPIERTDGSSRTAPSVK